MDAKRSTKTSSEDIEISWLNWCRLCAKQDLDNQERLSLFIEKEAGKKGSDLVTSIGKYFWVNIKADDEISQCLCSECKQLIEELVAFTERVNKVQTLYCLLQNIKPETVDEANKLRVQCGLIDEGWQHIIKMGLPQPGISRKLFLIDKKIQTETVVGNEYKNLHTSPEREEIINILQKSDTNEYFDGSVEADDEQVYEYVMHNDNDGELMSNEEYIEPSIEICHQEVNQQILETIEDENVQDDDIFKALKYQDEGQDQKEEANNFEITSDLEYKDSIQSGEDGDDDIEHSIEMLEEEGDEEDYVDITENQINDTKAKALELLKGKRGRPFGSKNFHSNSRYCFECKECKRGYKNPNIFRKHMLTIHNIVEDDLPNFKSLSNTCTFCGKQFLTRSSLKLHMRQYLPDEEKYNVPCPYCDRKFSQLGTMRQHVNGVHHQIKPFICDQCGRACKTMAALNEHQLVHTTECPFECEVCHKRFKNKPRLKSHMDTHNQSIYKCPDCGLELNTKRTLLQHRLVHSDVKRYKCEFCDSAFKRSKALKNHLILHSGLRPYKCKFCNKSFSNGSNCRAHKKRSHPRELAEEEANGNEPERVPMPKLEELKSAKTAVVQPRKIKRNEGGLPKQLRKVLQSSEKCEQESSFSNYDDESHMYESYSETHYENIKLEAEAESTIDIVSEECEETVIYEIIDEI